MQQVLLFEKKTNKQIGYIVFDKKNLMVSTKSDYNFNYYLKPVTAMICRRLIQNCQYCNNKQTENKMAAKFIFICKILKNKC